MSLDSRAIAPELDGVPPMGDLGDIPGDSYLLVEHFKEYQSKYETFAEHLPGVLLEGDPVDDSFRYFNQYPPPTDTWEMDYTPNSIDIDSPVGPSSLAPASHQPPPPLPSTSTTGFLSQKLYNCTYCGTLFDRYSRARDCRNMDLGLTPHQCLSRCGTVAW